MAFRGECSTSGYGIALTAAEQHGGQVDVQVQLKDPPAGAITLMVITYPRAFALLSRTGVKPAGHLSVHFLAQGQELAVVDANVQ